MTVVLLLDTEESTFTSPIKSVEVDSDSMCWACDAARQYDQTSGDVAVFRNVTTKETRTVRALVPPFAYFCALTEGIHHDGE